MATQMIGYDLNRPGQNYPELIEAIKKLGNWWHCLDSTWLVVTDWSPIQIREHLKPHIDRGDELLVATLTRGSWASVGFSDECTNWLKNNL